MFKVIGPRSVRLLVISITGTGFAFLAQVVVARVLGVEAYGYVAYVMALLGILVFFSQVGADYLLMRYVPTYRERQSDSSEKLAKLLVYGVVAACAAGIILATGTSVFYTVWQSGKWAPEFFIVMYLGMVSVPPLAVVFILQAGLIGVHKQAHAKLLTEVSRPLLFLAGVGGAAMFMDDMSASDVMLINVVIVVAMLVACVKMLRRFLPIDLTQGLVFDADQLRKWASVAMPLLIFSIPTALILQIDTLMLGSILGPEQSGTYWAVAKVASFVAFPLYASNTVVAPMIAGAHSRNESFHNVMRASAASAFLLCLVAILVIYFAGEWMLGLFGPQFTAFMPPLMVLCLGYAGATVLGPVDYALTMTGHERFCALVTGCGLVLCIFLNMMWIPAHEAMGAAWSTAVSLVSIRLALMFGVWKFHGVLMFIPVKKMENSS